jgi:hypothetical protein
MRIRRGSTEQSLAQAEDFKMDEECLDKSIVHAQIQGIQTELRGYEEKRREEKRGRRTYSASCYVMLCAVCVA